jgi:voltage-gated potassium channel
MHVFVGVDLRMLRILRLLRFVRLFRLTAYTTPAHMIANIFKKRKNELALSFILAIFLIIIASCIMYFAEHQAVHTNGTSNGFTSIPATIWWAVVSLTTTGYGDMIPYTHIGKVMASIIMLTGVAFFALPAGIITAGFIDEFRINRIKKTHKCPHCGEHIELDEDGHHHTEGH